MPLVDFDTVLEEIGNAEEILFMQALVRSKLAHGADNMPVFLIVTEDALFWGGSVGTDGMFHRIPLKSVVKAGRAGMLLWECVEITHMEYDGEKTAYLCPFTGHHSKPSKDKASTEALLSRLVKR